MTFRYIYNVTAYNISCSQLNAVKAKACWKLLHVVYYVPVSVSEQRFTRNSGWTLPCWRFFLKEKANYAIAMLSAYKFVQYVRPSNFWTRWQIL
jgi:hypothetical protein